ncbi:glycosyltransferase family 4 protein [bacterium]|nr:glycosyltransferase family 4 protein [bacterium]MBU1433414.1 glycosyltransferase family 4 protein [bacterium]
MRIALLTTGIYPYVTGGMQKHSYYLAKYLAKHGVYIDLYHSVPYDQALEKRLEGYTEEELKYINNYCFQLKKPAKYPGHYILESYNTSKIFYEALLENQKVDFIYAQGFSGWYCAKQKLKGAKLPPIGVNFHGLEMFQKAPSLRVKLEQYLFHFPVKRVNQLSDYTFSLGGKLTDILQRIVVNPKKVIVIPIGISETWLNIHELTTNKVGQIRKFVFIGRYERRKGIEELTKVIVKLLPDYKFEFHFIGPIPDEQKIRSESIVYHGLVKEEHKIQAILQTTDVLVSPSYAEGMPTVILEAMASGCAIIATDVGAVCEEVNEDNGWLIPLGNENSLKNAIIEAIQSSEQDIQIKKENSIRKIKENFLWDNIVLRTIKEIHA